MKKFMSRVITFSRTFPVSHPRKGQDTNFVEQIWNSLNELKLPVPKNKDLPDAFMWSIMPLSNYGVKNHTIRVGNRWKAGDWFSPRVWSDKPYASKQIIIALDIELKKVWDIEIDFHNGSLHLGKPVIGRKNEWLLLPIGEVAENDGLEYYDFVNWFSGIKKRPIIAQILCWNENINY